MFTALVLQADVSCIEEAARGLLGSMHTRLMGYRSTADVVPLQVWGGVWVLGGCTERNRIDTTAAAIAAMNGSTALQAYR